MKKSIVSFLTIGLLAICLVGISQAAIIDFESVATGYYTSLDFGDAVLTSNSGNFSVTSGGPWGGNSLLDYYDDGSGSKLTFSSNIFNVSLLVGDYNLDSDPVYLMAYDSDGNLLASDTDTVPYSLVGNIKLSLSSASAISYVTFYSGNPYPGSVYWDNIEYTSVPEPATMLLLGLGLMGLAGARRKFKK